MKHLLEYKIFESAESIIDATAGAGTDEESLVQAIAGIQTPEDLSKIDAELASNLNSEYKSVKDAIAGELGVFDTVYKDAIAQKFSQLGLPNYLEDGIIPVKSDIKSDKVEKTQIEKPIKSSMAETQTLSQGKININSNKSAPLIVVFGGIDVGGRSSGSYMYDYFKEDTLSKATTFIANSSKIDGSKAWSEISGLNLTPSKKILYLFSGGYLPGMSLLNKVAASEWAAIYLVDIWIGQNSNTENFYTKLTADFPDKVKYYYTGGENSAGGSNNLKAKKEMIDSVSYSKSAGSHMGANDIAVNDLNGDIS